MGIDLASSFTKSTRDNLHLYGVWPPGNNIKAGTYGILDGARFSPLGNIFDDFGIQPTICKIQTPLDLDFKSGNISESFGNISGDTQAVARVNLSISFKKRGSVLFRTKESYLHVLSNFGEVNKAILKKFDEEKWLGNYVLVTGAYHSEGTTIVISNSSNAHLNLEAEGYDKIDIADININGRLRTLDESNLAFKIVAQKNYIPLLTLSRLQPLNRLHLLLGGSPKIMKNLLQSSSHHVNSDNSILIVEPEISVRQAKYIGAATDQIYHMEEIR